MNNFLSLSLSCLECVNYRSISNADRKVTYGKVSAQCDKTTDTAWYRLEGAEGTIMPTSCPPKYKCNTNAPGWLKGGHLSFGIWSGYKESVFPPVKLLFSFHQHQSRELRFLLRLPRQEYWRMLVALLQHQLNRELIINLQCDLVFDRPSFSNELCFVIFFKKKRDYLFSLLNSNAPSAIRFLPNMNLNFLQGQGRGGGGVE